LKKVFPAKGAAGVLDELGDGAKRHTALALEKSGDHRQRVAVLFGPPTSGHAGGPDMSIELFNCDRVVLCMHGYQFNRTVI
jgi:hypothetical protein